MDIFSPCVWQSMDCFGYLWPITVWSWVVVLIVCFFLAVRRSTRSRRETALLMDFFITAGIAVLLLYGCIAIAPWLNPTGLLSGMASGVARISNADRTISMDGVCFIEQVRYAVLFRTAVIGVIILFVAFVRFRLLSVSRKPKK